MYALGNTSKCRYWVTPFPINWVTIVSDSFECFTQFYWRRMKCGLHIFIAQKYLNQIIKVKLVSEFKASAMLHWPWHLQQQQKSDGLFLVHKQKRLFFSHLFVVCVSSSIQNLIFYLNICVSNLLQEETADYSTRSTWNTAQYKLYSGTISWGRVNHKCIEEES